LAHQKINILGIIPARKGSKGIPHKNIRNLAGKPLIAYTIESAIKSKLIDKLIVSTDDEKAMDIAEEYQIEVPFLRPDCLSSDSSGSLEVVQHAIDFFERKDQFFDAVILLQPTTPFRENGSIDKAIEKFIDDKSDALVSVLPVPHQYNPHWVFKPSNKNFLELATQEKEIIKRRQDLPQTFYRDGSIYITKTEILKNGSFYGDRLSYQESDPKNHINLDTLDDWQKAEKIAELLM